jgi:glycosyltransferase involved in cell wall biosynthesis
MGMSYQGRKKMSESGRKFIAGLPAYNEEKYIGTLVLAARQFVDEVVVVDDGSRDNTAGIASLAGADVVRHQKNLGYGAAIRSLLAEARKRDADALVILDADSQHDPQEIPNLLGPISRGYDFVVGSRQGQAGKIPFYRRLGQKVILNSLSVLSGKAIKDSECGFRAFSRKALSTLELKENGMAVSAETIAEATRCNLKVTQVPVSVVYHKDSSTHNPLAHGLSVVSRVVVMISEQRPLFFFGMSGAFLMVLGLIAGIYTIQLYSVSRVVSTGWALVSVLFLTTGAASFFSGLLLHTISHIIKDALSREREKR